MIINYSFGRFRKVKYNYRLNILRFHINYDLERIHFWQHHECGLYCKQKYYFPIYCRWMELLEMLFQDAFYVVLLMCNMVHHY